VSGTMAESAEIIGREEPVGAELFGSEATHGVGGRLNAERRTSNAEF
jgi:hypothetical protein